MLVIEPSKEAVAVRHLGAPSLAQLELLLADGERAVRAEGETPDALLAAGNRAAAEGDHAKGAELAKKALHIAPANWPSRDRALEFLVFSLNASDNFEGCLQLARTEVPKLPRGLTRASLAISGMGCAQELKQQAASDELRKVVQDALRPPAIEMSADDRSSLYDVLVSDRTERGDKEGARALATEWARFLEDAAANAKTAQERTVFDSHRIGAYSVIGELEKLVPVLQEHERALPDDFNPPARLAYVFRQLGRHDEALAASDRALTKAMGPRRLRILRERSEILLAMKKPAEAKAALREAIAHYERLPKPQQYPNVKAFLEKRLQELK